MRSFLSLCVILLVSLGSQAGPQGNSAQLLVSDSGRAPSIPSSPGFTFPDNKNAPVNRYRPPSSPSVASYPPSPPKLETRQGALLGGDRGLNEVVNSLGDVSFDLGMRMPMYKFSLGNILRYFTGTSGIVDPTTGAHTSSLLKLNMGTMAALGGLAGLAALYYPQIFSTLGLVPSSATFRSNSGEITSEDIMTNVNRILKTFNIDADSCVKVALCTVGRTASTQHTEGRNAGTTPLDIIDTVLGLAPVKDAFLKKNYRHAREYGANGGDCEQLNKDQKCPLSAATWRNLLSVLNSTF